MMAISNYVFLCIFPKILTLLISKSAFNLLWWSQLVWLRQRHNFPCPRNFLSLAIINTNNPTFNLQFIIWATFLFVIASLFLGKQNPFIQMKFESVIFNLCFNIAIFFSGHFILCCDCVWNLLLLELISSIRALFLT